MKINRFSLGLSILTAAGLLIACGKKTANVPPEPDTETQTALDATWSLYAISDIEQMCAFMGENQLLIHPYIPVPGSEGSMGPNTGTMQVIRNQGFLFMAFNKTKCVDGRMRSGSVAMDYAFDPAFKPGANPNSQYYHEYGFSGKISLGSYQVDHYLIKNIDTHGAGLTNELATPNWTASKPLPDIKWHLFGSFLFEHDSVPSKNIVLKADMWKVLSNTNDKKWFDYSRTPAINWSLTTVGYYGEYSGFTNSLVPFKMSVTEKQQMSRDFTCYPDKIASVSTTTVPNTVAILYEDHHPFIKGVASFTTGTKYPRQIYYGNESNTSLAYQCDNTGEVMIKGIAYRVNFMK